ncbi:hypothetical protein B0O80DRAFT_436150 [Mortierella sp. GBAus27b]|nr:hypothetical protein B0O80DRAFT_436150 [Mortierella sp. GBAus27b]
MLNVVSGWLCLIHPLLSCPILGRTRLNKTSGYRRHHQRVVLKSTGIGQRRPTANLPEPRYIRLECAYHHPQPY